MNPNCNPAAEELCKTCDGFGWNYDRLGARITCPDCSGKDMRQQDRWRDA